MKTTGVLRQAFNQFHEDRALTLSAALAYYAILSLGPLLVIAVGVAGIVLSGKAAQRQVTQQLQQVVGDQAAAVVQSMMAHNNRQGSLVATILGAVTLLLAASGVFGQLKYSLNIIWHVKPRPGRGIAGLVLERLASMFMIFVIGGLLLGSMLLTTVLSAFSGQVARIIGMPGLIATAANLTVSLVVLTLLFALIYKWLPDVKIGWHYVWSGALFTAVLFLLGEFLLSLYLGRRATTSAYGAAGSVVLLLMWIYYSALILFFGAEYTKTSAARRGAELEPNQYALPAEEPYLGLLREKPA